MTLPCYDWVRRVFLVIHFITSNDNQLTEERVDLSVFSPACLPSNSSSLVGQEGHVYGEQRQPMKTLNPVLLALHLRLGRHWSPRDLDRQAARDCSSHRPKQQLYRENGPDRGSQRRPDCVCRGRRSRSMQGELFKTISSY